MQSGSYARATRWFACFSVSSRDLAETRFAMFTSHDRYMTPLHGLHAISRVWRRTLFLEYSTAGGALDRRHSSPSEAYHLHDGETIWTEPVASSHEACLLACLHHTVLLQIIATSPVQRSIIVLADDPR